MPEEKKRELQKEEESKFKLCPTCNKPVDPYYKNFHICEAYNANNKSDPINQVTTAQR